MRVTLLGKPLQQELTAEDRARWDRIADRMAARFAEVRDREVEVVIDGWPGSDGEAK